jgi:predicted S18 family serine protease
VGVELALAFAVYSARTGLPLPCSTVIAGELSLTGEIRPVRRLPGRIRAAGNLGFRLFLGPVSENRPAEPSDDAETPAGGRGPAGGAFPSGEVRSAGNIRSAVTAIYGKLSVTDKKALDGSEKVG